MRRLIGILEDIAFIAAMGAVLLGVPIIVAILVGRS